MVHSTKKHTLDTPRYRLIIPLKDPITPEVYDKVARRIAELIGAEYFDETTYDVNRFMYYPSVCKDKAEEYIYVYKSAGQRMLDANEMLKSYEKTKIEKKLVCKDVVLRIYTHRYIPRLYLCTPKGST